MSETKLTIVGNMKFCWVCESGNCVNPDVSEDYSNCLSEKCQCNCISTTDMENED